MVRYYRTIAVAAMLAVSALALAGNRTVSLQEVAKALGTAEPGDTLFVKPGTYADCQMKWEGNGTAGTPVVVCPEKKGEVCITGRSFLRIYGKGLVVSSLAFVDIDLAKGSVVEFRNGDSLAMNCRLTDCVIDDCNPKRRDISTSYVLLYGKENRVDHCSFLGKKSLGVTVNVLLTYDECLDNRHSVDHNYFGPRPVYGSNGAETMRVGTSQQCMQNSRTVISDNLFHRCNGEVEVVSIKSCENVIRDNVFYECEGVLALRHGDRCVAEGNVFIGNGVRNTGGIRIVGADQTVKDNLFFGCAGSRFFSALALMSAVPNSLPNRYVQVTGARITGNSFVDCASIEFGTGADFERTLAPDDILFADNMIWNGTLEAPFKAEASVEGFTFRDNRAGIAGKLPEGFRKYKGKKPAAPAFGQVLAGKGAAWYRADDSASGMEPVIVNVSASDDLPAVVAAAPNGSTVILADGLYLIEEGMKVGKKMTIAAAEGARPVIRFIGKKSDNMITIVDGGDLCVRGLSFDGVLTSGRALARGCISTAADMIEPYNLIVENCSFMNCGESGFMPVKGMKGTFAERVEIRGCDFTALSGDAIHFAGETEDKGRYNSDDVIIENCTFSRILGLPINIYRGGSDESTAGPYVYVRGCRFDDCCNKVRGSVIRVIGAQILEISDCEFTDSGRGGYAVRLDDAPWEKITVKGLKFRNSGGILSNRGL